MRTERSSGSAARVSSCWFAASAGKRTSHFLSLLGTGRSAPDDDLLRHDSGTPLANRYVISRRYAAERKPAGQHSWLADTAGQRRQLE
jgi:hypothetical protein